MTNRIRFVGGLTLAERQALDTSNNAAWIVQGSDENVYHVDSANRGNGGESVVGTGVQISDIPVISYTQIPIGFVLDTSNQQYYNTTFGRHAVDLTILNEVSLAPFMVGQRLVITAGTVTDANQVGPNIIWAGEVNQVFTGPDLGRVVNITVDAAYRSAVQALTGIGNSLDNTLVQGWNVWIASEDESGVVVANAVGRYAVENYNEFFSTYGPVQAGLALPHINNVGHARLFLLQQDWVDTTVSPNVTYRAGLYRRISGTGTSVDWEPIRSGIEGIGSGTELPSTGTIGSLFILTANWTDTSVTPNVNYLSGFYRRLNSAWDRITYHVSTTAQNTSQPWAGSVIVDELANKVDHSAINGLLVLDIEVGDANADGTPITLSTVSGEDQIVYEPLNDYLIIPVGPGDINTYNTGEHVVLYKGSTRYSFIISAITNFGGFVQLRAAPIDATTATTVGSLPAGNGVTLTGDQRFFDNTWAAGSGVGVPDITIENNTTFIGTVDLPVNTVQTTDIADNQITLAKMADNPVDTDEIVNDAINSDKLDWDTATNPDGGRIVITRDVTGADARDAFSSIPAYTGTTDNININATSGLISLRQNSIDPADLFSGGTQGTGPGTRANDITRGALPMIHTDDSEFSFLESDRAARENAITVNNFGLPNYTRLARAYEVTNDADYQANAPYRIGDIITVTGSSAVSLTARPNIIMWRGKPLLIDALIAAAGGTRLAFNFQPTLGSDGRTTNPDSLASILGTSTTPFVVSVRDGVNLTPLTVTMDVINTSLGATQGGNTARTTTVLTGGNLTPFNSLIGQPMVMGTTGNFGQQIFAPGTYLRGGNSMWHQIGPAVTTSYNF